MDDPELHVVTGAFGFIGRFITRRLLLAGRRVRTLTGHPHRPNPFGDQVSVAPYRFDDPGELAQSLRGAGVLYNTYWIRFPHRGLTFDAAVENTARLVHACRSAGVRRVVHVSVTSADEQSPLPYFRGKGLAERAVRESGLTYAILRPPLVYGTGDILVNNIAWFLRRSPIFPVMGDGEYRLQAVDAEELAEIAVDAGAGADRVVMDAVGPDTYSYNDLIRLIGRTVGSRARIAHVPPGAARALAAAAGLLVRDVVLTRDEITGLMGNLLVSTHPPIGRRRFSEWVAQHSETLGRAYASELGRHFR